MNFQIQDFLRKKKLTLLAFAGFVWLADAPVKAEELNEPGRGESSQTCSQEFENYITREEKDEYSKSQHDKNRKVNTSLSSKENDYFLSSNTHAFDGAYIHQPNIINGSQKSLTFSGVPPYPLQIEQRVAQGLQENPELFRAAELRRQSVQLYEMRRYSEAIPVAEEALEIYEKQLGLFHEDTLLSFENLEDMYRRLGPFPRGDLDFYSLIDRYDIAEPVYIYHLSSQEQDYGSDHPMTAYSAARLAKFYHGIGRYEEAEENYKRALDIREQHYSSEHSITAASYDDLAYFYHDMGRYIDAESNYKSALNVREFQLNFPDVLFLGSSPEIAAIDLYNSLGNLYVSMGRSNNSETLYKRSLELSCRLIYSGDDHPRVAQSLNNLARFYLDQGNYRDAEYLFKEALNLDQRIYGNDSLQFAFDLRNQADLYTEQRRYNEAKRLYEQAVNIVEQEFGFEHLLFAYILSSLAKINYLMGDFDQANQLYQKTLDVMQERPDHPDNAFILGRLAALAWAQNERSLAFDYFQKALAIEENSLRINLLGGSETNKRKYLDTFRKTVDAVLTFSLQNPSDQGTTDLALKTVLERKGRLLDLMANNLQVQREQTNPEIQKKHDDLNAIRRKISTLTLNPPEGLSPDQYQELLLNSNEEFDRLENDLLSIDAGFKRDTQPIRLLEIQQLLPVNSALIEYVRYRHFDHLNPLEQSQGEVRYIAFVLKPNGNVQSFDLGAANNIDPLIENFTVVLQNPDTSPSEVKEAARALEQAIVAPLKATLPEVEHLFISPDGNLNLIPFEALVDEADQHLVDQFTTTYLTSGRDLLRLQAPSAAQQPPLLVADPIFNKPGEDPVIRTRSISSYAELKEASFPDLPETLAEVNEIQSRLPQAPPPLVGSGATEAAIKQAERPSILHIATHGFFFGANPDETITIDNPLLRSGLLLSGFRLGQSGESESVADPRSESMAESFYQASRDGQNRSFFQQSQFEDGLLTALEVAGLNLFGTQLVVLSACDTGQGDTTVGEGVYGLRRALVLAGSRSQVISLWRVQSDTTKDLMVAYYDRLVQGEGRSEALRNTRRAMLQDPATEHPYYWAPFIQSGDWQPLNLEYQ